MKNETFGKYACYKEEHIVPVFLIIYVFYLMTLSVSRLYSFSDRIVNERGAVGE
jgi:hypothetical protein